MAFVSQEDKKRLAPGIKAVLKKYKMKGTIRVANHSKLIVNIKSGELDILGAGKRAALEDPRYDRSNPCDVEQLNHVLARTSQQVNEYWIEDNYSGDQKVVDFLSELVTAMKGPDYFDESDSMTDYFHCSHYIGINVGSWDKPYECTGEAATFEPVQVQELA